jgi:hypothetical protein
VVFNTKLSLIAIVMVISADSNQITSTEKTCFQIKISEK